MGDSQASSGPIEQNTDPDSDGNNGYASPANPATPLAVGMALTFGVVALTLGFAMFAATPGAWWWITSGACAAATAIGLTVGAWRRRTELVCRRGWALAVTTVYIVTAIAVTVAGTRRHLVWEVLAGAVLGAVIGGAALLVVHDTIRLHSKVTHARGVGIRAGLALAAALAILIWGMSNGGQLLAAEGVLIFTIAIIYLLVAAGFLSDVDPTWPTVGGLAVLAQAIVLLLSGRGLDLSTGLGIACWLIGLTLLKLGFGPLLHKLEETDVQRASVALAAITLVGGVGLWSGASTSNQLTVLIGFTVVFVGLSCLGICVDRAGLDGRIGWFLAGLGVVAAFVGFFLANSAIRVLPLAIVASVLVASVGAWFVLRGEGLVAIMLLGFVIIWGLTDRTTGLDPDPNPKAASRILVLGDSYISGEGALDYFEGTNDVGDQRNECRRAPSAYPYLVAQRLGMGLDFFACSGAKSTEVLSVGQMPDSPPEIPGAQAQLGNLSTFAPSQLEAIDVVLVSIGGNDVGFSTIIQACLLPEDCNQLEDTWKANVEQLAPKLVTTYRAIAEAVPNTPIVVVPYPQVLDTSETCGLGLRSAEHAFVVDFIDLLDRQIAAAAAEAGVTVFSANKESFAGHLLCDDEPATNHLHLSATSGDWLGRYSPDKWIHGSMHPSPLGHQLIADRLVPFLCGGILDPAPIDCGQVDPVALDDTADEPLGLVAPAPEEQSPADEAEALLEDGAWIRDELYATLGSIILPTGLLLVGGLLAAAGLVIAERVPDSLHKDLSG